MSACVSPAQLEALLAGGLTDAERSALLAHLDGCRACERWVAEALAAADDAPPDSPALGSTLGRYELRARLGSGGMGTVYRAFDPLLSREVAIKRLHPLVEAQGARMLDEARALARVAHPNVLPLYEVGNAGGHDFLVTPYVAGMSLEKWLGRGRPWVEVTRVFLAAARGLAAVHAAGLVHGDVKPSNVLVGDDGHVWVVDFGLTVEASSQRRGGTLAWLAPEVRAGQRPTPGSDQYSFFLALFEGLTGARPQPDGRLTFPRQVPGWLASLVRRGLSLPEQRWESLHEVSRRLERGLARRAVWTWSAAGLALVALGVGASVVEPRCPEGAEASLIWNAETHARTAAAFARTPLPFADKALQAVASMLDSYTAAWNANSRALCALKASAETRARRRSCLNGSKEALRSLVASLEEADQELIIAAATASLPLPATDVCLRQPDEWLADRDGRPEAQAQVVTARTLTSRAAVMLASRKIEQATDLATRALTLAADAGSTSAIAEARYQLGLAQLASDHPAVGLRLLEEAVWEAEASQDRRLVAQCALTLSKNLASQERFEEARTWGKHALVAVQAMPADDALLGQYEGTVGNLEHLEGHDEAAIAHDTKAVALLRPLLGEAAPDVLKARMQLVDARRGATQYEEALAEAREIHALALESWGATHPLTTRALRVVASCENRLGDYEQAARHYKQVIELLEKVSGRETESRVAALANYSDVALRLDQLDEARQALDEALRASRLIYSPNDAALLDIRSRRADVLMRDGRLDEARSELRDVIPRLELLNARGLAGALESLGNLELQAKLPASALPSFQRSLEVMEAQHGPNHPEVAWSLNKIAECLQRTGRWAESLPHLRRALKLGAPSSSHPDRLAETKFLLAQTLFHLNPRDAEGLALAREAETVLSQMPSAHARCDEVRAWLSAHDRRK